MSLQMATKNVTAERVFQPNERYNDLFDNSHMLQHCSRWAPLCINTFEFTAYLASIGRLIGLYEQILQGLNGGHQTLLLLVPSSLGFHHVHLVALQFAQETEIRQRQHLNTITVQLLQDNLQKTEMKNRTKMWWLEAV